MSYVGFLVSECAEGLADLLLVVEVVFYVADDLIGFVPFARDEQDVARPGEHCGGADGLGTVDDAQEPGAGVEAGGHLVEDRPGRLVARVVRGEDGRIGVFHRDLRHLGPFGAVAVAAAAADDDQLLRRGADLLDGLDDVFQCVGRMRIVDDGRGSILRPHEFEAPAHGMEHAHRAQHFGAVESQQHRGAVDGQQVIGVEASYEPNPYFLPVDAQQHAVDVHLDDLAAEIGHRAPGADGEPAHEKNWTKNLQTDDQTILRVAKRAQEMESMAIAKYQEAMAKYREEIKKNTPAEEDENHVLTKEEALQKLTESFEDHAKSLEGRTKQQDQSAQMLEDAIRRSSVWKNSSQRAQQFLAAQDKKKENPENLPEHFSENVIKAGAMFRDKFVKNGQENNVSIQNLLSDISLW